MKRTFDLAVTILALVVLLPIMALVALAIVIDDGLPVVYRGRRTGRFGSPFYMFKFRTMVRDAESRGGTSTGARDPRVTRIGWFLRRTKLDELPQFFNVLRGEMSLVGPRPEVEEYTRLYEGEEQDILSVRPGITDFSSVEFVDLATRLGSDEPDRVYAETIRPLKNQLRLKYVRERSFATDLRILWSTAAAIVRRR